MEILRKILINDDPERLESRNIIWNILGSFLYAFSSMVLTILVVQLVGDEQGGIFTFAFTTFGQQMFMVAYFGIRPYQITDVEKKYTFGEYLHLRMITSAAALILGVSYILLQGYSIYKASVIFFMVCYKVIDGFVDTYEAEFQRGGRLYLTGKSNTFRTIFSVGTFFAVLYGTRNLVIAGGLAVIAQLAGAFLFDVAILRVLPNVDWHWSVTNCKKLAKQVLLLFLSVFLDFYIFSAAKYAIERYMGDAAIAVYGAIFMPTSVINLVAGFVIRPFLMKLSIYWEDGSRKAFIGIIRPIVFVIFALTMIAVAAAAFLGIPVMGLLYPNLREALKSCRIPLIMIILGGGFNAWMNLFYYILVIMERQQWIFAGYVFVCIVAAVVSPMAVVHAGIMGGAASYLFLMVLLVVCFGGMTMLGMRGKEYE